MKRSFLILALLIGTNSFAAEDILKPGMVLEIPASRFDLVPKGQLAEEVKNSRVKVGESCKLGEHISYTNISDPAYHEVWGGTLKLIGKAEKGDRYLVKYQAKISRAIWDGVPTPSVCADALYFLSKKELLPIYEYHKGVLARAQKSEQHAIATKAEAKKVLENFEKLNKNLNAEGKSQDACASAQPGTTMHTRCQELGAGSREVSSTSSVKKIWGFSEDSKIYKTLEIWGAKPTVYDAK